MSHDSLERGAPFGCHRCQQRRLKPASMLVAAFEIHIRGVSERLVLPQYGAMAYAGLKPHVHDVGALREVRRTARGTLDVAKQFAHAALEPNVDAFLRHVLAELEDQFAVQQRLAAIAALQERQRNAPRALPRDDPVETLRDGTADTVLAPRRHPSNFLDLVQRALAQPPVVERDKPLLHRAKNDWVLAPPAMRIRMRHFRASRQCADAAQVLNNWSIRFENELTRELPRFGGKHAAVVDRRKRRQSVLLPDLEVFGAMAGRGVNETRALLQRHVRRQDYGRIPTHKRMTRHKPFEVAARHLLCDTQLDTAGFANLFNETFSDKPRFTVRPRPNVREIGLHRDGEVGR